MSKEPVRGAYDGLRDRDYFHIMLNLDSFEGFLPKARELAEAFLADARKRQDDQGLEPELRLFPYSRDAFEARLDEIYNGLVADVARYEANKSWTMRTREDVIEWMLQMAPFNQTDGAWLRRIAPVGPIDETRALLFAIFADELGAGDPKLNHANIYTELLRSVGIELPEVRSREYAENPDLVDAAFTLPLFQLVVSEFPQDFFPELLGMTQYLEWGSVELRSMVMLHEHFGLDPHFYEMHVAIDNAASGHGAMVRRAVERHIEQTRVSAGDEAMREQWERVWNGYVAFATTGSLAQDVAKKRKRPSSPADKVIALVEDRASKASLNHGQKRLGGELINDLFADPRKLMSSLVDGGMIVPGDPDNSPFFELLTSDGPMFKIFSEPEIATWREWTMALEQEDQAPTAEAPAPPLGAAERMRLLVDTMRARQEGAAAHQGIKLTGPNPANPGEIVTEPVAWWFAQPTSSLIQTIADPANGWIAPGNSADSKFVSDLLRGKNAMARALDGKAPDGATWAEIAIGWIDAGCPLPLESQPVRPLTLLTPPDRVAAHPTGVIHGTGSVH